MKPFWCLPPSGRKNPNPLEKSPEKHGGGSMFSASDKCQALRKASGEGLQILDEDGGWNMTLVAKSFTVIDISESMNRFDRFRRNLKRAAAEDDDAAETTLPLIYWINSLTGSEFDGGVLDVFDKDVAFAQIQALKSKCLCTKQGWMLFARQGRPGAGNLEFFLQNISSGARKNLPQMISGYRPGNAAIAMTSGSSSSSPSPDYVVHVSRDYQQRLTTIHVARPGDKDWQAYSTTHHKCISTMYAAVIAKGTLVYCFDYGDQIAVFDLVDRVWSYVDVLQGDGGRFHVMEVDDEIVRMSVPRSYFEPYEFCKLRVCWGEKRAEWVEMGEEERKGRSYFVDGNGAFSMKGGREVVYQFGSPEILPEAVDSRVPEGKLIKKIEAFDLNDCVKRDFLPCYLLADVEPVWINL